MGRRILIIQGRPDPAGGHLCHAIAQSYASGASRSGHEVRCVDAAQLEFPIPRTQDEIENSVPVSCMSAAQETGPLWWSGITPVRSTLIGSVAGMTSAKAEYWIENLKSAGRRARSAKAGADLR